MLLHKETEFWVERTNKKRVAQSKSSVKMLPILTQPFFKQSFSWKATFNLGLLSAFVWETLQRNSPSFGQSLNNQCTLYTLKAMQKNVRQSPNSDKIVDLKKVSLAHVFNARPPIAGR